MDFDFFGHVVSCAIIHDSGFTADEVPVVDDDRKLIGVVHREAVNREAARRVESDYLKSQGIVAEELRTITFSSVS